MFALDVKAAQPRFFFSAFFLSSVGPFQLRVGTKVRAIVLYWVEWVYARAFIPSTNR